MKKKIAFSTFLLLIAVFLVSFSSLKNNYKDKRPLCNCNNVLQSTFHATRVGTTTTLTWNAPAGDAVSYYSFGGYFDCDGSFGTITTYTTSAQIPNPSQCDHGTIRMTTHCTNGCVSSGVILTW